MELKGKRRNSTQVEEQREREREKESRERVGNPVPPGECQSNVVDHE